jgi:hypothetical protein
MYRKKILNLCPADPQQEIQLGYFTQELFWNLLFHRQLKRSRYTKTAKSRG